MYISDLSIRRPVFATMAIVTLVVLGIIALRFLPMEMFPDVSFPVVVTTTVYPGAGPEEVETLVSRPIEDAVSTIGGLKRVFSTSREGVSQVVAEFYIGTNVKLAAVDVREKVSAIRAALPKEIEEPVFQRIDPSQEPVLWIGVSGARPSDEIRRLVEDRVKPYLEQIPDVGEVGIVGGQTREIQVLLDRERLEAFGIPVSRVVETVAKENINIPGGHVVQSGREITVRAPAEFKKVSEIGDVVVDTVADIQSGAGGAARRTVRVRDLGRVVDGFKEVRTITRMNGQEAVFFFVRKQSGGNTVALVDKVKARLAGLGDRLPRDVQFRIAKDQAKFVLSDLSAVRESLVLGIFFAIFTVFIFMRDWRSTFIVSLSLPASLIGSFFFMWVFNFSINMMTLMALSLVVGVLIDDAIVVRENIFRHMERGEDSVTAARKGTTEIGMAVMATTFTIVAVFFPVAFMSGIVGQFFRQFGLSVVFAVGISLLVAFTLDPMLSAHFMKPLSEVRHRRFFQRFSDALGGFFSGLDHRYRDILTWALSHRLAVILGALALFALSILLVLLMGGEFVPKADHGQFNVTIETPTGSSLALTNETARRVEEVLRRDPDALTVFTTVGPDEIINRAVLRVEVRDKKERKRTIAEIKPQVRAALQKVPGIKVRVEDIPFVEGGDVYPVTLYLRGDDLEILTALSQKAREIVRSVPGTVDVDTNIEEGKPEFQVRPNRDRAADFKIGAGPVAATVRTLVDGQVASRFREGDKEYDIRVRLREEDRQDMSALTRLLVNPPDFQRPVALMEVADIAPGVGPGKITREDRQRQVLVTANLADAPLGTVVGSITEKMEKLGLPKGVRFGFLGEAERMQESFVALMAALALSVIFIYMVLASQYNSFVHPFTIMLSLPLAIIGALIALFLMGKPVGMPPMIGIVMLMGLVTKNGILLVDYTNTLRARGLPVREAILEAGPTRLRPILMTSTAMILGMLPVAVSTASGSEFRSPMAIAIIGGLITSSLLTLVVVPVVYTLFEDCLAWRRKRVPSQR
ncbi:MAG: hypothetical protein A2V83_02700 [Nitrospirae bacterium RBG_16_64_22]|nr:MAG: hypothetical protein A2V83_02700 [Nitrospirae bacterium RBG_16_64_22]